MKSSSYVSAFCREVSQMAAVLLLWLRRVEDLRELEQCSRGNWLDVFFYFSLCWKGFVGVLVSYITIIEICLFLV